MSPAPRRKAFVSVNAGALTLDEIDALLKKELGAKRVSAYDRVKPQPWAKPTIQSEREAMGLFDHLADKGVDLDNVPLDPFKVPDGDYECVFVSIELKEPEQENWGFSLEINYQVAEDGPYNGRGIREFKRIPTEQEYETDSTKAERALSQTFQRLHQLGFTVEEIKTLDVIEMNDRLRGEHMTVTMNTPLKNNPKKTQFVQMVVREDENSASSILD